MKMKYSGGWCKLRQVVTYFIASNTLSNFLTLGAHAQRGDGSCPVSFPLCLEGERALVVHSLCCSSLVHSQASLCT